MDKKLEMKIRQGYASIFDESRANDIQDDLFPELDSTFDFDLETDADEILQFLKDSNSETGDVGVRIHNFDAPDRDMKVDIARCIKGYWEGRSFMPDSPDTVILISGTSSLAQYENSLSGRVYHP